MNITITVSRPDALILIKLLSDKTEASAIVKEITSALSKDRDIALNKQVMS